MDKKNKAKNNNKKAYSPPTLRRLEPSDELFDLFAAKMETKAYPAVKLRLMK